jgi:hypothetical protein
VPRRPLTAFRRRRRELALGERVRGPRRVSTNGYAGGGREAVGGTGPGPGPSPADRGSTSAHARTPRGRDDRRGGVRRLRPPRHRRHRGVPRTRTRSRSPCPGTRGPDPTPSRPSSTPEARRPPPEREAVRRPVRHGRRARSPSPRPRRARSPGEEDTLALVELVEPGPGNVGRARAELPEHGRYRATRSGGMAPQPSTSSRPSTARSPWRPAAGSPSPGSTRVVSSSPGAAPSAPQRPSGVNGRSAGMPVCSAFADSLRAMAKPSSTSKR